MLDVVTKLLQRKSKAIYFLRKGGNRKVASLFLAQKKPVTDTSSLKRGAAFDPTPIPVIPIAVRVSTYLCLANTFTTCPLVLQDEYHSCKTTNYYTCSSYSSIPVTSIAVRVSNVRAVTRMRTALFGFQA